MKGLIVKDLYLLKDNKMLVGVMFAMAIMFMSLNSDASFLVAFMTMIMSMLVITTISYDDFDHSNSFLMTLPVTRALYVKEKYCLGVILAGSGWLLSSIIATVVQMINVPELSLLDWFTSLVFLIILGVICSSLMIPVQLKYGGDKGRIAMIGCILFLLVIGYVIVTIVKMMNVDLSGVFTFVMHIPLAAIMAGIVLICVLCFYISYRISLRIMLKKQF